MFIFVYRSVATYPESEFRFSLEAYFGLQVQYFILRQLIVKEAYFGLQVQYFILRQSIVKEAYFGLQRFCAFHSAQPLSQAALHSTLDFSTRFFGNAQLESESTEPSASFLTPSLYHYYSLPFLLLNVWHCFSTRAKVVKMNSFSSYTCGSASCKWSVKGIQSALLWQYCIEFSVNLN